MLHQNVEKFEVERPHELKVVLVLPWEAVDVTGKFARTVLVSELFI